ncbi:MAG: hypothetical protein H7A41_03295 [Chlamydiales bacterium]|nr:hypothetical protein [Chlamydiia bacterium]MCP5504160.1 hypothetical protein [Chlamydiales bacterium]
MRNFFLLIVVCFLWKGIAESSPRTFDSSIIEELKPKLNTQRIQHFFGSVGVEVLEIDSSVFPEKRISNLHSLDEEGQKQMRTLAIVDFAQPIHPDLTEAHQEIVAGGAIGTTLQKYQWKITNLNSEFILLIVIGEFS